MISSLVDRYVNDLPKFGFQTGLQMENHVLKTLAGATDVAQSSEEIRSGIVDWTTYYHLSPVRSRLLEPLADVLQSPILEIGAGMGALTRSLGERGHSLTAVDASISRRRIVRERCRDLPSVETATMSDILGHRKKRFNTVLLIGVLEYSPSHYGGDSREACLRLLSHARDLLTDEGRLVLAIENQLGGAYFAGAPEDHNGVPFYGIEDRYSGSKHVTFGRLELSRMLRQVGFESQNWLFPFPDYKFPTCILAEQAVSPDSPFDPRAVLRRSERLNPSAVGERTFEIGRAWAPIWRNGLLGDMANSFLVSAACTHSCARPVSEPPTLAWIFPPPGPSVAHSSIHVVKASEWTATQEEGSATTDATQGIIDARPAETVSWSWSSHTDKLCDVLSEGASSTGDLSEWFDVWWTAIKGAANLDGDPERTDTPIPADLYDALPSRLVHTMDGPQFRDLDDLSDIVDEMGSRWLIYRALLHSFTEARNALRSGAFRGLAIPQMICVAAGDRLPPASSKSFADIEDLERRLLLSLSNDGPVATQ